MKTLKIRNTKKIRKEVKKMKKDDKTLSIVMIVITATASIIKVLKDK
ncbi:MAG: hypothetical protein JST15_02215 [Bacteroidetes bacterium]|nr:hypothetical protein [Bacteroidota bacterium]